MRDKLAVDGKPVGECFYPEIDRRTDGHMDTASHCRDAGGRTAYERGIKIILVVMTTEKRPVMCVIAFLLIRMFCLRNLRTSLLRATNRRLVQGSVSANNRYPCSTTAVRWKTEWAGSGPGFITDTVNHVDFLQATGYSSSALGGHGDILLVTRYPAVSFLPPYPTFRWSATQAITHSSYL